MVVKAARIDPISMADSSDYILAFNRGVVSPLALARADVKRIAMSAETQTNWIPRALGPMSVRPGLQYIGPTASNNPVRHIPFVFAINDTALVGLTNLEMTVRLSEVLITRPSVSTTITNGTFNTDLTGWTDADEGTIPTSVWLAGGYMSLLGDGTLAATRDQTLTISAPNQNVEHALRIVVAQGGAVLRVGSTAGGDEYISETTLRVGTHSLAFTPTGASVFVRLFNRDDYATLVDSCTIEAAGIMSIPTTITTGILDNIRSTQSGDVIFLACGDNHRPLRIERRATRSWSIVNYVADNGPLRSLNLSPVTITPSALFGTITLTASKPTFKSTNVGGLYSVSSIGQSVTQILGAEDVWSDPIRVSGVTTGRNFTLTISGTWVGTVTLQRSVGALGAWTDVTNYTTNQAGITVNDTFDNQIIYYQLGIKVGNYTSGSATASLVFAAGSITGIARVTSFASSTSVTAVVLKSFGAAVKSSDWAEGSWSDRRHFPTAVAFFGARLWWAGQDKIWASVVDDFANFDDAYVGDAGPIDRSIGTGPVDQIRYLIPLQQLVAGAEGAEFLCRSSSLEEPLTPTNFNLRESTTYGSGNIEPVKVDASGIFVDRSGARVMEAITDAASLATSELSVLAPEICLPGIVRMAVQRRPETRVHLVRSDGVVVLLVFEKVEEVKSFTLIETDGLIENVVVLPGTPEDSVYYTVARIVGGVTVRYIEKWAKATEAKGGVINKMADSCVIYSGASTATITGLTHLEGKSVVCWANSKAQGTFTVSGGSITIPEATTYAVTGLAYTATFVSAKLGYSVDGPNVMSRPRRIDHLGLILRDVDSQGLEYGTDINYLDNLPPMEDGVAVANGYLWSTYDKDTLPINGVTSTDVRLVLRGKAPRPCTVAAAVVSMETGPRK